MEWLVAYPTVEVVAQEVVEPASEPEQEVQPLSSGPPPVSVLGWATHYCSSYTDCIYSGGTLGCGTGTYTPTNETIAADRWTPEEGHYFGCGTRLEVCGPAGCHIVTVQDACPGCSFNVLDLSEAANELICGTPPHTCEVEIRTKE